MGEAYAQLQHDVQQGMRGLLNPYAAQDPAEFFAVVTECFFEQGAALARHYPAVYSELQAYYRLNPAQWGD